MTTDAESRDARQGTDSVVSLKRLKKGIIRDLPTTFQPYFNQQVSTWDDLFPYEREYVLDVLTYLDQLNPHQRSKLFAPILQLEKKMGVKNWNSSGQGPSLESPSAPNSLPYSQERRPVQQDAFDHVDRERPTGGKKRSFSVERQTLEDASLLARSPYYQDWRRAVQEVFDQIGSAIQQAREQTAQAPPRRLILMIYPECLPFEPDKVWKRWPAKGKTLKIASGDPGDKRTLLEALLGPGRRAEGPASGRLLDVLARRAKGSFADVWALDAGAELSEFLLGPEPSQSRVPDVPVLSFDRLKEFRRHYLDEVNTMNHSLSSADQILSQIRKEDVSRLCPPEVNARPIVREFVRSLFMTGNGSPVSGNPFVQWGAAEALRRARPSVIIGCFGTRNKPKPFTSVAVFVNQSTASPLPSVIDYPGSALDASILSYYVWLSSTHYPEYQDALTVCIAGSARTAYVIGPEQNPLQSQNQPLTLDQVSRALAGWLASPS
jgi:hypothetical protein